MSAGDDLSRKMLQEIERKLQKAAKLARTKARVFLAAKIKEVLNEPAPKRKSRSGRWYATVPATPGAPPRKLTGRLQKSVTSYDSGDLAVIAVTARSDNNFNYPKYHELQEATMPGSGQHPFLQPTVEQNRQEVNNLVQETVNEVFGD